MSRPARKPSGRRIQPYAWLGAGAVTVGMGVALVGGTAVAFADTGADSAATASASDGNASTAAGPRKKATRAARGGAAVAESPSVPAAPIRKGRVRAALDLTDIPAAATVKPETVPVQTAPAESLPAPTLPETSPAEQSIPAATVATATPTVPAGTPKRATRSAGRVAAAEPIEPVEPTVPTVEEPAAPAAAVPGPAADPAPEMTSWLPGGSNPGTQIVPGAHVELALQEIAATQGILTQQTWGSGNVLAGVVAIVPQVFLAGASLSLSAWGATNPGAQDFLASVAGIPIIHQIAQVTLLSTMVLPGIAEASMGAADLFMPLVGLFGADIAAAQTQLAAARQDGKVYAVIPIRTILTTQPMVGVSINGAPSASLLIDTGASGLVTTADKVGGTLGEPIGSGNSCFSGGLCYHYETYTATVDLGGGAVTSAPVNIVTNNDEYQDSVATFEDFFSWGADGILGVGANTAGPGPAPIPTAVMPGELSNGLLIFQNVLPFGLLGFMVLGPNPLPTRVSVPGAPDAYVQVSVNDGPKNDAGAIIDSGGVFGTLNRDLYYPGTLPEGASLPFGTKISVYTADGATLLYTYTTQSGAQATPTIEAGLFNTGNAPFAQGPIYLDYGFDDPYGIGSTDFSIW